MGWIVSYKAPGDTETLRAGTGIKERYDSLEKAEAQLRRLKEEGVIAGLEPVGGWDALLQREEVAE